MFQKVNTALLVAILGVLVFLHVQQQFTPQLQAGRYQYISGIESVPTLLDTATGEFVLMKLSAELKKWRADKNANQQAESESLTLYYQERMQRYCSALLSGKKPDSILSPPSREQCEEWQQAQSAAAE